MTMLPSDELDPEIPGQRPGPDDLPSEVDLEELAQRVFALLLQELEMENDRTGKS
jgi:hypothetical protein